MGWGAAQAFYEENSEWLDSPEDAYEALYGPTDKPAKRKRKHACDKCGKRFKSASARDHHHRDVHAKSETGQ
jgi:hypothetical protein